MKRNKLLYLCMGMWLVVGIVGAVRAEESSSEVDSVISIDESANWLSLPEAEKSALYAELDQVKLSSSANQSPTRLSNVKSRRWRDKLY